MPDASRLADTHSPPERRRVLRERLGAAIARGATRVWTDEEFNRLALEIFRYQTEANPVYGTFVRNRGIDPGRVADWRRIPAVPTRAFKEIPLVCEAPGPVEAVFETSGTTGGGAERGRHLVRDLSLYRLSLLAMATAYLRPELERAGGPSPPPLRVLALIPSPERRPESSLAYMAGTLMEAWGDGRGGFFADADGSIDIDSLEATLERGCREAVPTLMLGTAFAFVHWLDRPRPEELPSLPPGSLLMETGGYKGRSRALPRDELYARLGGFLGLPSTRMVNEYGMTELLSQFYEPVLREDGPADVSDRRHVGPPWVRTRVLDPGGLEPVPPGEPGLLCHHDLANLDSVAAVLTEDCGVAVEGGFRVEGRVAGAEPRGCSLSMEDLLRSVEGAP